MPLRLAIVLTVALPASSADGGLIALQRPLPPRQVAVEWLTAKTVADAVRHLPPATVAQVRALQKSPTPEKEAVVDMVEPMLAPLVFSQLMGGTLRTTGWPVSTITVSGNQTLQLNVLNVAMTGDTATVHLRVRAPTDSPEEAGAIELRRDGVVWRIVAANLGSKIPLPRFDLPNYLDVAIVQGIEQYKRERMHNAVVQLISRLRTLMSAQLTYAAYNGGFFAPPDCLMDVAKCKTPVRLEAPPLTAGALDLAGYDSRFYPGPRPSASEIASVKVAAQSLKSWAHVFSPTDATSKLPAMCGDSTGRVCRLPAGRPEATGGVCPATCADVK